MTHHPRYQRSLDELFLHVYVYIDDWLAPHQAQLPQHSKQKASISELLTIAVVGELLAQPFESIWYWLVQQHFGDLFPSLPEYSRYHRVLRNAEPLLAGLALSAVAGQSQLHLIDSKPLPIAKGKRASWAKLPEAAKGFSTMGMVHGFKLHALTDEQGLFKKWAFAPANHSDVTLAGELLEGMSEQLVLGDKAYIGSTACTPKRKNMPQESNWQCWMNRARKRIEASFSSLVRSLTLHAAQVKTFASLKTRVNLKIAAFNLLHSGVLFR
jgi:hypothetical protein